jgi:hypothetical protein
VRGAAIAQLTALTRGPGEFTGGDIIKVGLIRIEGSEPGSRPPDGRIIVGDSSHRPDDPIRGIWSCRGGENAQDFADNYRPEDTCQGYFALEEPGATARNAARLALLGTVFGILLALGAEALLSFRLAK